MTYILGLNAYHGDSSACLIKDGVLIAAAEEERFVRVKHWAGFPGHAIRYCLEAAGIGIDAVDHIAMNRDPRAHLLKKGLLALKNRLNLKNIKDRLSNLVKAGGFRDDLVRELHIAPNDIRAEIHHIEHHLAHLASSFFVSPYPEAALLSVDGFGDFVSTMWGAGAENRITVADQVFYPHSLGLFYLAITQYLGFMNYGDEYKVMGLAPYGNPTEMEKMRGIVRLTGQGGFELDLDYFIHHSKGVSMIWEDGAPEIGTVYSEALVDLLGPPRKRDAPITDAHRNIAASLQAMYEEAFFHILDHLYRETGNPTLCLSGGCAMNSVANGKIFQRSRFSDLYIQSAAGDGGGAIGAAFLVWHQKLNRSRGFVMDHAFWGPAFDNRELESLLKEKGAELEREKCRIGFVADEGELCRKTAEQVAQGKVVGWFQGRMEWGPRALGNRSIVCDPRRPDMKDILNHKIKRRESFRPFAPSILREAVRDWFETDYDVPFMLQVYQIREEKRGAIPAVTHVNGSGRLQTVAESENPRYYRLIRAFEAITGTPLVLNTSFNENEPVVCTPQEALLCFLRTRMDVLVMGNWYVQREE